MFPIGKLPPHYLVHLLEQLPAQDKAVVLGPGVGRDCAVLDLGGDQLLVAKSDPITFATDEIGWYAVHVNANDIVTTGATPRWFLSTILLPLSTDSEVLDKIFADIEAACKELGVTVVGGHTEITHDLKRPIVLGSMLGLVPRERLIVPTGARTGDAIILTKRLAVEATAILARERYLELAVGLSADYLERCKNFLHVPGISVAADARIAIAAGSVHAMHDPTEGGLATALNEMAVAAGVNFTIDGAVVPSYSETRTLCNRYGLDLWGVIASGSLLIAADVVDARHIVTALRDANIDATVIGRVTGKSDEPTVYVKQRDELRPIPRFVRDEIAQLFE
jgi:hydrogenase maturation factor